jgi:cyclic-di-AMP phosphodiesterase PgpH
MIAESAADAVGANPVIARVGAYFHDIGKIKKPLYFSENQRPHENRHDKLSTSMSALIIRSHVKDGMELAAKHGLPQAIRDMIPQHHGTSRIEFFYGKACKEAEEAGESPDEVDPSLYSYPGPKPQTREAGILMLADGMEAAARTIEELTHDRIQGMVQKKINKIFASGQLDECELTLKDLHLIAKCFTRVLTGIYHQRIAYAEPAEKISEKLHEKAHFKAQNGENGLRKEDPPPSEMAHPDTGGNPAREAEQELAQPSSKEDLKRLGI